MIASVRCPRCNATISGDFPSNQVALESHNAKFHSPASREPDSFRLERIKQRRQRIAKKFSNMAEMPAKTPVVTKQPTAETAVVTKKKGKK
jgi:hypothetical protein